MPDLLLELFSEEITARMQRGAMENLQKLVTDKLVDAGLTYEGAKAFATPRRIALSVHGLPAKQPDRREEKKGPRVGAPKQAIDGFLKAAGLKSIDEAKVQPDKKGDFYLAVIEMKGRPSAQVIADIIPDVVRVFPWPKSMRWGAHALNWVRPLHSILCTFGPETEEPQIVKLSIDGVAAGDLTYGHRVHAPGPIKVKRLDDYLAKLAAAKVVPDPERRKETILADAKNLACAQGLELVEDLGLLEEVAGLVEWPVVLLGSFDAGFLDIPPEVIRTTIRNNQRCFVLRDPATAKLANKFVTVANLEASDGGEAIKTGVARVIRARLADAKFFWEHDRKKKLEERLPKLKHVTFHKMLGTQWQHIERIEKLAVHFAGEVFQQKEAFVRGPSDPEGLATKLAEYAEKVSKAARLCKADLLTDVVGEFPELQGTMGKYYAEAQGEDEAIAHAIEDHYKPQGPSDMVPADPVSVAVALADKIDTLVGFWAIGEKPTGSKDPYALRRSAIGVIRIILENNLRIKLLSPPISRHFDLVDQDITTTQLASDRKAEAATGGKVTRIEPVPVPKIGPDPRHLDLLSFFADRLKVHLRENGARHDLVDAVFALEGQDDLVLIVRRVEALGRFLNTDDGKNLLVGYRRAVNILRDEEKKDNKRYFGDLNKDQLKAAEEKGLTSAIEAIEKGVAAAVQREDFESAMLLMAKLRAPVDAFFDKVTVNVEDKKLRENRLKLLNRIRAATRTVADFSRIEG